MSEIQLYHTSIQLYNYKVIYVLDNYSVRILDTSRCVRVILAQGQC